MPWKLRRSLQLFLIHVLQKLSFARMKALYLGYHTTHKDETCTVTLVRTCRFQWCQYCWPITWLGVSTAKKYVNPLSNHWCSNPLNFRQHPSAPKAAMVTKIRLAAAGCISQRELLFMFCVCIAFCCCFLSAQYWASYRMNEQRPPLFL